MALNHLKRQKFKNVKVKIDGITFDSKKEGRRYLELKAMEKNKEIKNLKTQPSYLFLINGDTPIFIKGDKRKTRMHYVADFEYFCPVSQKIIVEDVKSKFTKNLPVFKIKRALFEALYDQNLYELRIV